MIYLHYFVINIIYIIDVKLYKINLLRYKDTYTTDRY